MKEPTDVLGSGYHSFLRILALLCFHLWATVGTEKLILCQEYKKATHLLAFIVKKKPFGIVYRNKIWSKRIQAPLKKMGFSMLYTKTSQ